MIVQDIKQYHALCYEGGISYYTELFSKPIWGDMGEDCASITLYAQKEDWKLHFVRTQSGEPFPLSETVCNIIDEYEKILKDEEIYDFLALHRKLDEFAIFIKHAKIIK